MTFEQANDAMQIIDFSKLHCSFYIFTLNYWTLPSFYFSSFCSSQGDTYIVMSLWDPLPHGLFPHYCGHVWMYKTCDQWCGSFPCEHFWSTGRATCTWEDCPSCSQPVLGHMCFLSSATDGLISCKSSMNMYTLEDTEGCMLS